MSRRSQTGTIFNRYERLVERSQAWASSQPLALKHCSEDATRARLVQRFVELTNEYFTNDIVQRGGVDQCPPDQDLEDKTLNGIVFVENPLRISLASRTIWRCCVEFMRAWTFMLLTLFRALMTPTSSGSGPAAFFLDAPIDNENKVEQFIDYCRNGPIEPLKCAKDLFVQASFNNNSTNGFRFSSRPINDFIQTRCSRRLVLALIAAHLSAPVNIAVSVFRSRIMFLLAPDAALLPVFARLDREQAIDAAFITTSRFVSQPVWMKGLSQQRFPLHMIWYSQNSVPKVYQDEKVESDLPSMRHIRADVHWVWTPYFADYLRGLGQSNRIETIGPIMFYLPADVSGLPEGRKVAIFDINPIASGLLPFGTAENYYTVAAMKKFVVDAIAATEKLADETGEPIWCLLKHKRAYKPGFHDTDYHGFLQELESKHSRFRLVDNNINLFGLLSVCDTSMAVPYTSTCLAATWLQKPSIYYDPYAVLVPHYEKSPLISFANHPQELVALMRQSLATI